MYILFVEIAKKKKSKLSEVQITGSLPQTQQAGMKSSAEPCEGLVWFFLDIMC